MAGETLLTVVGSLVTTSYPGRAGLAVYAGCGRPAALPVVDSGLSTTDAGASDVAGSTPVPSDMCSDPQQPPASSPDVTNVTASPVDLPHATDPDTARKKLIAAFGEINVTVENLESYLGHKIATCSPAEIGTLRNTVAAEE